MQYFNLKSKNHFWLFLICLVFLVTRLVKITEIPSSLYWDEASIGYNAHAVLAIGRDEWGEYLPLHFRAFGEFKLPVYIYSVVLAEAVFGYGEFSVRLPAVIYSLGILLLIYLIVKKMADGTSALWAVIFFVLSPWGLLITRVGYEVTAGTAFFLLAWYFFLKSKSKPVFFLFSVIAHVLAMYSYNSFRVISPLFFTFSLLEFFKKKHLIIVFLSMLVFIVSLLPVYKLFQFDSGRARMDAVSLRGDLSAKALQFTENYISHFSINFLFFYGDVNPRSNYPGQGLISIFSVPVILLGLVAVVKKTPGVLLVLIIAPIAACLTRESPHALRSFLMFPLLAILFGMGAKNRILLAIAVIFIVLQFESYTYNFYQQYNYLYSNDWQLPYKQTFIQSIDQNKPFKVSDKYGQPYIFALYYQKYDPLIFKQTVVYNPVSEWGFSTVKSFGNFEFVKL